MSQVGLILNDEGHYPEAEKMDREAFAIANRKFGPNDPITVTADKDKLLFNQKPAATEGAVAS